MVRAGLAGAGLLRPDLAVPLVPATGGWPTARRWLAALREPAFAGAHRQTTWLLVVAVLLLAAGQFGVVAPLRWPVGAAGAGLAVYTVARTTSLTALERHQYAFEPVWLAAQSDRLRAACFEVVRCAVDGRTYDLTDPDAAGGLLATPADTRIALEFTYVPARLERIYLRRNEIEAHAVLRAGAPARVRFPHARYGLRPSGRTTQWLLGVPAVLTVAAPAGRATARGGTRSTDRPDAAPHSGGRPPGTTSAATA